MSTSQVYAVLKRLEAKGLVIGSLVVVKDAPARTEYSLTQEGEQRLKDWLFDPHPSASIRLVRIDFLSKLYVARLLGWPAAEIIRSQQKACLDQRRAILEKAAGMKASDTRTLLTKFILGQLDAAIRWLEGIQRNASIETNDDT